MPNSVLLYFVCVLVGFGLLKLALAGTFLAGLATIIHVIGLLAVIVFSLVLLYMGIISLLRKNFK